MDGPAGWSGWGAGSKANVYTPVNQPQADTAYSGIVSNLFPYANNPSTTPGGVAYQQSQPFTNLLQDPNAIGRGITGSFNASDYFNNSVFPGVAGGPSQLAAGGNNILGQAQ